MVSQSFPRKKRLVRAEQFKVFFSQGECIRLKYCRVFRVPNKLDHFRLGITIKTKARSIDRNKVKRIIREQFRILSKQNKASFFDYNVVIDRGTLLNYVFARNLQEALRDAFLYEKI